MPLVVVVEDDPASQKTVARLLRAGGFDAAIYSSAEDFLASPPQGVPVGLLLYVHLGGMSGLDLQRRLRNEGSTVPVIIITAFDDARSRERVTDRLADGRDPVDKTVRPQERAQHGERG